MSEKERQWSKIVETLKKEGFTEGVYMKIAKASFEIGYITGKWDQAIEVVKDDTKRRRSR